MFAEDTRQLCRLFADVLEYPDGSTLEALTRCISELNGVCPESARPMQSFLKFAQAQDTGRLEELYTRTFDIVPAQTLYVGYHIFGETPKRSTFLVRLQEAYQSHQFSSDGELPDHLCILLRFLSIASEPEFVSPLIQEALLPALEKLEEAFKKDREGYGTIISSLKLFLKRMGRSLDKTGGVAS
ncbi:MAG: nitrate reductase molybdenum cofactor assembly chaperone [Dehalococcoidales bacterium]|nr:nitrate reductase molybdenum cofactor assembly chaperone [Dehalococcoidales bacterium]